MNVAVVFAITWILCAPSTPYVTCHRRPPKTADRGKNHPQDVLTTKYEDGSINSVFYEAASNTVDAADNAIRTSSPGKNFENPNRSFPSLVDVAPTSSITANATCGTQSHDSEETFCKLGGSSSCSVCSSIAADKKHPITYAIDGNSSHWWQSPTYEQGPKYEYVTITMDLKQEYYVWNVIVKCAISPRPASWLLERSIDGTRFSLWQYFVSNEEDCWQYGLPATTSPAANALPSDNETLCSTFYSKLRPLENGEIHAFIAKGRPGCTLNCTVLRTDELKEFSRARFIRLRFQKLNVPKEKLVALSDPTFQRRLFYSIKKISVGAQCICNGHASKCKRSHELMQTQCECIHNTCGNNCEKCCPLYNQKPWKEGTISDESACEQCQCHGHATACQYDSYVVSTNASLNIYGEYQGGGVCINCSKHTAGINCEKCESGWYRPHGVYPDAEVPCVPCDCHQIGSTGHCTSEGSDLSGDGKSIKAGTCTCLEGFGGLKCDRCAVGYFNFPNCEKCKCNPKGTDATQSCEMQCLCKANVEGEICDKCKMGYFELSATNPLGCSECYCSGVANSCHEANGYRLNTIRNLTEWLICNTNASSCTSPTWDPEVNVFTVFDNEVKLKADNYFWSAPNLYLGNRLSSYGLALRVSIEWSVMRGDTSGKPVYNPDIIIMGKNGLAIAHGNRNYEDINKMLLSVRLNEKNWYQLNMRQMSDYSFDPLDDQKNLTKNDMLSILSDVKHILLRSKFHTDQIDCSLLEVELEIGVKEDSDKALVHGLEQCNCPAGYTGLSCEKCDYGYARVEPESPHDHFVCSPCDCNGHSSGCNIVTGQCDLCQHNTTGTRCEKCVEGFYGNAENGSPEDCKICACPLVEGSNNFSPTCISKHTSTNEYICDKCPLGYTGTHCEICSYGYFGNPMELGSKCEPCNCGGNACNRTTGECLECEGNTEGRHCEQCKEGFYGNPEEKNCLKCNCDILGSENVAFCDVHSGQCSCRANYSGRTCDRCLDGFANPTSGCTPCNCNSLGSENEICDSITGQCTCKNGVIGQFCERCIEHFFGFISGSGCRPCNCDKIGSSTENCEEISGQCYCRPNVTGRTCNRCKEGYWGFDETGCKPCECDDVGSISHFCDGSTGQCVCKYGVTGRKCDHCQKNFYGFSKFGCFECETCKKPGHICDVNNGRCVCPSFVEGARCERCVAGAWNYNAVDGCRECKCDKQGSRTNQCNPADGQCDCRLGFSGNKCDACAPGYYGFPRCRPCSCNLAGSNPETCSGDHCLCDNSGQCYCKVNTVGKKCDQCREGTFGLHVDSLAGCTACFCFNRSTECTEAGLIWSHIRLRPDRLFTVHYNISNNASDFSPSDNLPVNTQEICFINWAIPNNVPENVNGTISENSATGIKLNITNNLRLIPGSVSDVEIGVNYLFNAPVYWQLPSSFLGDKVLSYGGFIEFTTETEGDNTLLPASVIASYPLVQMQGNDRFILEYFPSLISFEKRHRVRLHESLWKLKNNPLGHVSREIFMLTLQNLQHILIRASHSIDFHKATLSDVSMDIAVKNEELFPQTSLVTHGIELCECPSQYSSSSCQNPSIGYYRYYENRTTPVATITIQVIGEAIPCNCSGRSSICNINTGVCLNCSNNTGGDHCERCADGYYRNEFNDECRPCPCPSESSNHAFECYISPSGRTKNVTCFCRTGYKGKLCDGCEYGWYGYPKIENGSCKPCDCNPFGMISNECHEETGQCNCKPDTTGRDCSVCKKKNHILTPRGCTMCTDQCVKILVDYIEAISKHLVEDNEAIVHTKLKPPWHLLQETMENMRQVKETFDSYTLSNFQLLSHSNVAEEELKKKMKTLVNKIRRIGKQTQNLNSSISVISNNISLCSHSSFNVADRINAIVSNLKKYVGNERTNYNLAAIMNEARTLHRSIIGSENFPHTQKNEKVLSFCRKTFENIRKYENSGPGLLLLQKKIDKLNERAEDFDFIVSNASSIIKQVHYNSKLNSYKLHQISNIAQDINDILLTVYKVQEEFAQYDNVLDELNQDTEKNLENVLRHSNKLKETIKIAGEKEGILFDLNSRYLDTYVRPAAKHADDLLRRAQQYIGLLSATKHDADIALKASKAYKNIVDALAEAKEAIRVAANATNGLINQLVSNDGGNSVIEKARTMEKISRQIKILAETGLLDVDLLWKQQYEYQQKFIDSFLNNLRETNDDVTLIFQQLSVINRTNGKFEHMKEALEKYMNATQVPDEDYDSILNMQDNITEELRPKLKKIQKYGDVDIHPDDEFEIKNAVDSVQKVISQFHKTRPLFTENEKNFEKWNSSISDMLLALRNKIEETRHLTNGIQLSVSSRNDKELCSRGYQMKFLTPTITNYISITYAVSTSHRDALLFYLENSISGDFLAVEMVNRKIRFVWDLGGGVAELTHQLHIQTAGDLQKDQHWYKIDVTRIGNVGQLSVRPVVVPPGSVLSHGMRVTNSSKAGWNRFDVSGNDEIWIGRTNKPANPALLSKAEGLIGCLYRVSFDNRPIGLWNFRTESKHSCTACVEGAEEIREDDSYFFTGDGYSAIRGHTSSVYNKYYFSVTFNFKTYDENSILFFAAAAKRHQYIAIIMKEGRIVFQIGYTEDIKLEIKSSNRYTTGNWTYLEAARYYDRKKKTEKGILKVGGEVKEGVPFPSVPLQADIPDLSMPHYFFGGLSPGFEAPTPLPQSFLGCMSDLQVIQEAYNPLRSQFWNVHKSCSDKSLTLVGFKGSGYIELPSYPLKKSSSFSFMFSTIQPNAFLMLSTTEGFGISELEVNKSDEDDSISSLQDKDANYYSVSLVESRIELIVNAGNGATRLLSKTDTRYNDGQWHSVTLLKTGKRLELRIDDVMQAVDFMEQEGMGTVHAAGVIGGLFFGGLPADINLNTSVVSHVPFIGTICDVIFNDKLVNFNRPIEFEGALLGRLGPQTSLSSWYSLVQNTEAIGSNSCRRSRINSMESNAVQFGDQPESFVRLDYNRQIFYSKNSTIELQFRTFYADGILLVIQGDDEKQNHHVKLFLHDGKINLHVKAKKLHYEKKCDDGNWHHVRLTREGRTVSVQVDNSIPKKKEMMPKRVNLKNVLFVGGCVRQLPIENSVSSLKGCIKEVIVNGKTEDLISENAIHHRVGQCFPQVEKGAYFSGDSYSVAVEKLHVGKSLNYEFEFRTSESYGILMSVSEQQGYPALSLELIRGKIVLNGDMGDRRPFRIELEFLSSRESCDNEWHRTKLLLADEKITLTLDNQSKKYWLSDNGHITEAQTNSSLYIGGIPENAPYGTIENKENFKGCLRNVIVGERKLEWTEFFALHDVMVSSCPAN